MVRKEKEITDRFEIEAIINRARVCRIALCENNYPYVIPVCFGYKDLTLYFHCARTGKKLDILWRNPNVCFEVEEGVELKKAAMPCNWGFNFRTVIGYGTARILEGTSINSINGSIGSP